jgi:hypothetical protein
MATKKKTKPIADYPEARTAKFRVACVETAEACIGKLERGCRVIGITKGQFSLLDLIRACMKSTGPVNLVLSTWTTGIRDAENAGWLLERGELLSVEMLTDRSFQTRQPKYCRRVRQIFGDDSILVTRTHAKFALLWNDEWSLVIRSSMNLNRNPRFEQFDIDDDPKMLSYFQDFVGEIRHQAPKGILSNEHEIEDGFNEALVCNTCGGEVMAPDETDDVLGRITQLSGLQFTRDELLTMLSIEEFSEEQHRAYERGRLLAEEGIRQSLLGQAQAGDMKAVSAMQEMVDRRKEWDEERPRKRRATRKRS